MTARIEAIRQRRVEREMLSRIVAAEPGPIIPTGPRKTQPSAPGSPVKVREPMSEGQINNGWKARVDGRPMSATALGWYEAGIEDAERFHGITKESA